jgi:hypothetical protein
LKSKRSQKQTTKWRCKIAMVDEDDAFPEDIVKGGPDSADDE